MRKTMAKAGMTGAAIAGALLVVWSIQSHTDSHAGSKTPNPAPGDTGVSCAGVPWIESDVDSGSDSRIAGVPFIELRGSDDTTRLAGVPWIERDAPAASEADSASRLAGVPWIEGELGTDCGVRIAGVPWIERETRQQTLAGAASGTGEG